MITLICGRPRAGKTTYSKNFFNVYHLDDGPMYLSDKYRCILEKISGKSEDIVVEGIYSTPEQRKELLSAYKGTGYKCIWVNTNIDTIRKRYNKYFYSLKNFPYPFTAPTYDEGWDEIIEIGE